MAPTTAPTTASTPSAGTTVAHPIDLSHVQPCKQFTKAVNRIANVDGGHAPLKTELPSMPDAPACFNDSADTNLGLTIAVSTKIDLNSYDQSRAGIGEVQRFTVRGYPALTIAPRSIQAVCFAGVGMADHQFLYLQYALASPISTPKVPQPQLCSRLHSIASQVVSQLTH